MCLGNRSVLPLEGLLLAAANVASSQKSGASPQIPIHLQVEAGTPLRVYITRRVPYRVGEAVEAKVIEPVWVFDRFTSACGVH